MSCCDIKIFIHVIALSAYQPPNSATYSVPVEKVYYLLNIIIVAFSVLAIKYCNLFCSCLKSILLN